MPPTTYAPTQRGATIADPDPDTSHQFVHGNMTHQQKREFLFSDDRVSQLRNLDPRQKERLARLLAAPKIRATDMPDLIGGLSEIASNAGAQISVECYNGDPRALTGDTLAHWDIKEMILEEIVNRSHHHPPQPLTGCTQIENQEWQQTTLELIFELLENGNWKVIPETLLGIDLAARNHNELGGFPPRHTMREAVLHYSNPKTREMTPGGNVANPSPPDPEAPPSELAAYIGRRIRANEQADHPQEDLDFVVDLLRPYLDQDLMQELAQWDPPHDRYHQMAEPHTTRALRGPSDQPLTHIRTTYQRILRYNLADTQILQAVSTSDQAKAAAALRHIVGAMDAASGYLRNNVPQASAHTAYQSDRSLRWQTGAHEAWRTAHRETKGFATTGPLGRKILIATHELQQLHHQLTQRPAPPDTALATLAEAAAELRHAGDVLELIDRHRDEATLRAQLVTELIEPAQRRARAGDDSPSLAAMLESYEQQNAALTLAHMAEQIRYHEPASQALREMRSANLPPATLQVRSEDHRETALLDRILRALLHVDYLLHTTAHVLA